ncbi:AB-hydrolase lipase domain [Trinorchestia longiramus]|nr:AB-hydrolase lipase domain [Trinorchestia longiramus]
MTLSITVSLVLLLPLLFSSVHTLTFFRSPLALRSFFGSSAVEPAEAVADDHRYPGYTPATHLQDPDVEEIRNQNLNVETTELPAKTSVLEQGSDWMGNKQRKNHGEMTSSSSISTEVELVTRGNTNEDSTENEIVSGLEQLRLNYLLEKMEELLKCDPRTSMTVPELIRYYGFGAEIHHVTTSDGYILELHRLLGKTSSCAARTKRRPGKCRPVLLQHGLLSSSSAWVLNEPSKALGYILAEQGYDVWLGNARGNIYSLNHTTLDVKSFEFWDFSFDEMGKYDLPAVIDYILTTTKFKKLHYVGHSMGTTMFWVLSHEHPQFTQNKVVSMSALGPVAFVSHAVAPIMLLAPFNRPIGWLLTDVLHEYRLLNPDFFLTKLLQKACCVTNLSKIICRNSVFLLIGFDKKDLDLEWLPVILSQINAGASTRTVIHFAQIGYNGNFAKFDYHSGNMAHYNQTKPPLYDLSRVKVPVLLKWGDNDFLADPTDVQHLNRELRSCPVTSSEISNPKFNHLDFLWGRDAAQVVYKDVMDFMRKHS